MRTLSRSLIGAVTLLILTTSVFSAPGDMVGTPNQMVQSVKVQNSDTDATYFFLAVGGWQAANCPGVTHAYIRENAPGAKAILAAALAAKAAGLPDVFREFAITPRATWCTCRAEIPCSRSSSINREKES